MARFVPEDGLLLPIFQRFQEGQDFIIIGDVQQTDVLDVADYSLAIDDENIPVSDTFVIEEDAVLARHLAVGPEVGQEIEGNSADRFRP